MILEGWYYLHENGSLIYKRQLGGTAADIRESDFTKAIWPFVSTDRAAAWRICVEGLALGAKPERVKQLAELWHCSDDDAYNYARHINAKISMDGTNWCATRMDFIDLQSSPAGFGESALEALANLAVDLGLKPGKMWNKGLAELML